LGNEAGQHAITMPRSDGNKIYPSTDCGGDDKKMNGFGPMSDDNSLAEDSKFKSKKGFSGPMDEANSVEISHNNIRNQFASPGTSNYDFNSISGTNYHANAMAQN
jgi:hypothetical protein